MADPETDLDADLLDKLTGDDAQLGITQLYDRHARRLHATGMQLFADEDLAGHLVLDSFVRLLREAGSFDRTTVTPRAYLASVVRASARRLADGRGSAPPALADEDAFAALLADVELRDALTRLDDEHRTLLELVFVHELERQVVASQLQSTEDEVDVLVDDALRALRERLPADDDSSPSSEEADDNDSPEDRADLDALGARLSRLSEATLPEPPAELRDRTLAALAAAVMPRPAGPPPSPERAKQPRKAPRKLGSVIVFVIAVVAAVAAVIYARSRPEPKPQPVGKLETRGTLTRGSKEARIEIRRVDGGRSVRVESTTLPVLRGKRYYEVWFVGRKDSRKKPNRISAGTFRTDANGGTRVTLRAAVDTGRRPRIQITREPDDGDPRATGPPLLDGRLAERR